MTQIRKVVFSEFGDVSKVNVVDAEISAPSAKHVQVKIIFSNFSGADINMRMGTYPRQPKAPLTPGYTFTGVVVANGPGAKKFKLGDIVTCLSVYGGQSELANVPEKHLIKVPSGLDLKVVTSLVLDWNTAYGLIDHAKVQPGQSVFIHGLSGAVGNALSTLCRLKGARIYGTASERNHDYLRKQGATPFVYTNKRWIDEIQDIGGVDVVFDALGYDSYEESFSILNNHGHLVGFGGNFYNLNDNSDKTPSQFGSIIKLYLKNARPCTSRRTSFWYISRDDSNFESNLKALFDLVAEEKISVPIKAVFDLEDIRDAHEHWGKGSGMGSYVIQVAPEKEG